MADPSGSHTGHDATAGAAGAYVDPASARAAVSRGRFLTGVTLGLGGLIGAAITVPVVGFALGPSFAGEDWYWSDLGPTDQFTDKYTTVLYERGPQGHIKPQGQIERQGGRLESDPPVDRGQRHDRHGCQRVLEHPEIDRKEKRHAERRAGQLDRPPREHANTGGAKPAGVKRK